MSGKTILYGLKDPSDGGFHPWLLTICCNVLWLGLVHNAETLPVEQITRQRTGYQAPPFDYEFIDTYSVKTPQGKNLFGTDVNMTMNSNNKSVLAERAQINLTAIRNGAMMQETR